MRLEEKIIDLEQAIQVAVRVKEDGQTLVTHNGSFDLIHSGHVFSIIEAKEQGDVLMVLVNSDKSVASYKGPNRPVVPQAERAKLVAAIEGVDYILIFDEINPKRILNELKPNIHCNGSDWGKDCVERDIVERNGGKIHILEQKKGFSTSQLIKAVLERYSHPITKAVFIAMEDHVFSTQEHSEVKKLSKLHYLIISLKFGKTVSDNQNLQMYDNTYSCRHSLEEHCDCRMPGIGLLLQAVRELGISLNDSWLVGSDVEIVQMGREANLKTVKLGPKMPKELKLEPNQYVDDLASAIDSILRYVNKI